MTTGESANTWQNRPSLISGWTESVYAEDFGGFGVQDFTSLLKRDGGNTDAGGGWVPLCIPRACRLVRFCALARFDVYDSIGDPAVDLGIFRTGDCNDGYALDPVVNFNLFVNDLYALNCFCGDINICFDECDQWYPYLQAQGDPTLPIVRINFFFELR